MEETVRTIVGMFLCSVASIFLYGAFKNIIKESKERKEILEDGWPCVVKLPEHRYSRFVDETGALKNDALIKALRISDYKARDVYNKNREQNI